jgi:hypothetical protein
VGVGVGVGMFRVSDLALTATNLHLLLPTLLLLTCSASTLFRMVPLLDHPTAASVPG